MRGGQPAGLAVELGAVVAAVQVDAQLARTRRQAVVEGDLGALAGWAADRRPGEGSAVGPHPRLRPGQDLQLGLADRDREAGAAQFLRDRQRRAKGSDGGAPPRSRRSRRRTARANLEGQQRGKCAAAQGAEEGSAP
jgi:hypothetical protein